MGSISKRFSRVRLIGALALLAIFALMYFSFYKGNSFELVHVDDNIFVFDNGRGIRQFKFSKSGDRQSEIKIGDVEYLPMAYSRAVVASLIFLTKSPMSILMVGLGGGTLPTYIHKHFPLARLDIVEMHQKMLDNAEAYSNFKRNDNVIVHISDGLEYVEKMVRAGKHFDLIIQDGCASTPCDLLMKNSMLSMSKLLSPEGVYIQNIIGLERHSGVVRNMQEAFRELYYVESKSVNQIFVGYNHDMTFSASDLVNRGQIYQMQEKPQFDVVGDYSTQYKRITKVMINAPNYQ